MSTSSGERGTKSQQQDRQNARDRANNGGGTGNGGGSGSRGTKSQQQDRRNLDTARRSGNSAPGVSSRDNVRSNPASQAIPGMRNVALHNAGLPEQSNFGPKVGKVDSRGNSKTVGTRTVPAFPDLMPNGVPPQTGVIGGLGLLADAIINDNTKPYGDWNETADITTRDMGLQDGNLRGNTGGRDVNGTAWLDTRRNPDKLNPNPNVVKPGDPAMTLDDYLAELTQNYIQPNSRYYLEQRGLIDPSAPEGIPAEWQPYFDREFNRIKGTLPQDLIGPNAKEEDVFNQLRNYYSDQFGKNALDAEELRRRNDYTTQLNAKGYRNQLEGAFGDTADDSIIESIINPQYQQAQDLLTNQQKRGTLTNTGFNYGMKALGEQRNAANTRLQGIGAQQRSTLSGGVNDYLDSIYGKASGYKLGEQFDPNSFDTEFGNRLTSAQGGLEGGIRGAAPSNLFDTGTVLSNAGTAQGQSSRGGLLDTLANRRSRTQSRGLGTTGAF